MFRQLRTALAALAVVGLSAGVGHAQTVDEVIAKNLAARGGVERLKALTSAKITGDVVAQDQKIHIVTYAKRPNLMRREQQIALPPNMPVPPGMGSGPMKVVVSFDGTTVWTMSPATGNLAQPLTGEQADLAKQDTDFDSVLLDYKAKGHKIDLVGTETIDGKPTYHLKITKKIGLIQDYYLDVETGLETRMSTTIDQGGTKTEVSTDFSNYRTVEGLAMPFTMKQSIRSAMGSQTAEVTISKWEVNVPMDDDLFKMPSER